MTGNWVPVKLAEILVCCSSRHSDQKLSWTQSDPMDSFFTITLWEEYKVIRIG